MAKKASTYKAGKKRNFHFYLRRLFLSLFVGIVFYAGTIWILYTQNTIPTCANSKSCTTDLSVRIDNNAPGIFHGKKVIPPKIESESEQTTIPVLGATAPTGDKQIYIDLSSQTLYAYQGNTLILKTFIASGKWGKTPTGNFHIWEKLRATRMAGGEGADAYDLPNVPYVMYFYRDFGLHGAYWHDNFGHVMSHGCVNMRQIDAKALFEWADGPSDGKLGTPVSVCDKLTAKHECVQNNPIQ